MSRRLIAWLVTLPLAVAGTQLAHALAYRLVTPAGEDASHELSATGHGYLQYLPLLLAIGGVLVTFALAAEVRHTMTRADSPGTGPRAWQFALVAPAIFIFQEHFERLLHDGTFPWNALLAASVITGLALQLPFGLAAYVVARLLLRVARSLGSLLAQPQQARLSASAIRWPVAPFDPPRLPALALGYGSRGPPSTSR